MRRFGFYILVALLTFGFSSFVAFSFYCKLHSEFPTANKTEASNQTNPNAKPWDRPWKTFSEPTQKKEVSTKLFCEDAKILPIWKELINDKSFQNWEYLPGESLDCANMVEVVKLDLNGDNQKEFIIRGKNFNLCSAVGNCAFWIYKKKGNKYKKILASTDYSDITGLPNQIKQTRTRGYFDIVLKGHLSASDTNYQYYKFDGRKYVESKCLVKACFICSGNNPKWKFVSCQKYYKKGNY